jgi:hypothetical protein
MIGKVVIAGMGIMVCMSASVTNPLENFADHVDATVRQITDSGTIAPQHGVVRLTMDNPLQCISGKLAGMTSVIHDG